MQSLRIPTSDILDKNGCWRHPSSVVLDKNDFSLPAGTKEKIGRLSLNYFDLDLNQKKKQEMRWKELTGKLTQEELGDPKDGRKQIDARRDAAFFLARSVLLKAKSDKTSSYWEQFEGLYAMLRNVMLAMIAASMYFLGWAASFTAVGHGFAAPKWLLITLLAAVYFSFARKGHSRKAEGHPDDVDNYGCPKTKTEDKWNRRFLWCLATLLAFSSFFTGAMVATAAKPKPAEANKPCAVCCSPCTAERDSKDESGISFNIEHPFWLMVILALATGVGSGRAYRGFKEFAREFALAVWRDFANFEVSPEKPGSGRATDWRDDPGFGPVLFS